MLIGLASSAWPLVWRVLLSGILVVLIYTVALRIHKPSDEQHTAFVPPPRSLYTKQWVPFNSDAVSALAAWRMGLYSETLPESKVIIEDILDKRCSSLFPGDTPATSCFNGTRDARPIGKALSLVYPGDTSAKVLERIMADAAEEAFTDARTQALHAGETLERAQAIALNAVRRAQHSDPARVLMERLPKYGAWRVEIDRDQLIAQGVPAAPSLAAIAEALSTWLIKIEAVRIVLEEVIAPDDEYDDVRLTADELGSIDVLFATILDTPSGSIQAQPGCIKAARYKPLPRNEDVEPSGVSSGETARELPEDVRPPVKRRPRSGARGKEPGEPDPPAPQQVTEESPAPSPDRAQAAWRSANQLQKELETRVLQMDLPPPEIESYGAGRLAQVSAMSREVGSGYNELFRTSALGGVLKWALLQRADAKHQLFEHMYDEADTVLNDRRVAHQLKRVLALIKHLLGPEAQAQGVLNDIWRTYMHSALLHSYTIACASVELRPAMCPRRAAAAGLPKVVEELKQLSRSQQEDLGALVETVFNVTVPLAPVRPPVLHWDARVQPNGALLQRGEVQNSSQLWIDGVGEPRPDLWVVHPDVVMGTAQQLSLAQVLQRANIRRYLALQVWQLDDHAADWGVILQTEDVRPTDRHGHIGHYLRSMRVAGRRIDAKPASQVVDGAPGDMSVGDLLASLLRARLASMDAEEQLVKDEDV